MFTFSFLVACNQYDVLKGHKLIITDKTGNGEKCFYSVQSIPEFLGDTVAFRVYDACDKFQLGDEVELVKKKK